MPVAHKKCPPTVDPARPDPSCSTSRPHFARWRPEPDARLSRPSQLFAS